MFDSRISLLKDRQPASQNYYNISYCMLQCLVGYVLRSASLYLQCKRNRFNQQQNFRVKFNLQNTAENAFRLAANNVKGAMWRRCTFTCLCQGSVGSQRVHVAMRQVSFHSLNILFFSKDNSFFRWIKTDELLYQANKIKGNNRTNAFFSLPHFSLLP